MTTILLQTLSLDQWQRLFRRSPWPHVPISEAGERPLLAVGERAQAAPLQPPLALRRLEYLVLRTEHFDRCSSQRSERTGTCCSEPRAIRRRPKCACSCSYLVRSASYYVPGRLGSAKSAPMFRRRT